MVKINHEFREKLNEVLGGITYNYCYQCGACVANCPAHRFNNDFNPRNIVLEAIYGMEEELLKPDSQIWNCTNCYNCYERCPQGVNPIEVIIALKNMAMEKGTNPPVVNSILERVKKTGKTVVETDLIRRRRTELNLPDFKMNCEKDLEIIFNQ